MSEDLVRDLEAELQQVVRNELEALRAPVFNQNDQSRKDALLLNIRNLRENISGKLDNARRNVAQKRALQALQTPQAMNPQAAVNALQSLYNQHQQIQTQNAMRNFAVAAATANIRNAAVAATQMTMHQNGSFYPQSSGHQIPVHPTSTGLQPTPSLHAHPHPQSQESYTPHQHPQSQESYTPHQYPQSQESYTTHQYPQSQESYTPHPHPQSQEPYRVLKPDMFNVERYMIDAQYRNWCEQVGVVAVDRRPSLPSHDLRQSLDHQSSSRRDKDRQFEDRGDQDWRRGPESRRDRRSRSRDKRSNRRSVSPRRREEDRRNWDKYEREFKSAYDGPEPGHPYYPTWYDKFIRGDQRRRPPGSSRSPPISNERGLDDRDRGIRIRTPPQPGYDAPRARRIGDSMHRGPLDHHSMHDRRNPYPMYAPPGPRPPKDPTPPPLPDPEPDVYQLDQFLSVPGRKEEQRLRSSLILMRGPPGSGKTHIAKIIQDKEKEAGAMVPKVLSIDDYFMVSPENGKGEMVFEYEAEMEDVYLAALLKAMKKVIDEGSDRCVIIDACNWKMSHIQPFLDCAKHNCMKVFLIELRPKLDFCLEQNIHKRTKEDINQVLENWEKAPPCYPRLDPVKFLPQKQRDEVENTAKNTVKDVSANKSEDHNPRKRQRSDSLELSDAEDTPEPDANKKRSDAASQDLLLLASSSPFDSADEDSSADGANVSECRVKSKWDIDNTETALARMDGLSTSVVSSSCEKPPPKPETLEDFLMESGDDYMTRVNDVKKSGKKRVRWADIEERRSIATERKLGFIVGITNWDRLINEEESLVSGALTKTQFIDPRPLPDHL